jgi:[acyl-carrier-protein] S-malonyltransferase
VIVVPEPSPLAVLFPGQGASVAGARALVQERRPDLYALALELLDADPYEHARESTRYAQPAIHLASLAGWCAVRESVEPAAFAGHSLGELSALSAAGVWNEDVGLRLVVLRAELMANAGGGHHGGMLALLKADVDAVHELAERHGVAVANDNGGGQVVLSGDRSSLEDVAGAAREMGFRAIRLDVTGAFHSPAMRAAVQPFEQALRAAPERPATAPVYSALTAAPFRDIAHELSAAICAPVRWRETIGALDGAGVGRFLDVGPDAVLQRLIARELPGREALHAQELGVAA